MKVGDRLYCFNIGNTWANRLFTVGRSYVITQVDDDRFWVICDIDAPCYLYLDSKYFDYIRKHYYWRLYFLTLQEIRKDKLKKLKSVDTL